jgi:hypothetical protein
VSSSLWPAANSAPWSIPCKAALERACLKFGESKMTAPKSWRPAGLQYVSQKRGTPVIYGSFGRPAKGAGRARDHISATACPSGSREAVVHSNSAARPRLSCRTWCQQFSFWRGARKWTFLGFKKVRPAPGGEPAAREPVLQLGQNIDFAPPARSDGEDLPTPSPLRPFQTIRRLPPHSRRRDGRAHPAVPSQFPIRTHAVPERRLDWNWR